jgi:uncharacterized surface protein with fasciclin (FAS1) repeats
MRKTKLNYTAAILSVLLLFGLIGCEKDNKKMYEPPTWLGGSSIETLEGKGNYTIYLQLMEKAGLKDQISKQLFALFVPDDDAFKTYFQKAGIGSVDDLTLDQARELFNLHVLANPRSTEELLYERSWGVIESAKGEWASLFFRRQTASFSAPYQETVTYATQYIGRTLTIRQQFGPKLLPLFSKPFFADYLGASDGSDYTFMYPGSNWGGLLQWGNAMVIPQEQPATLQNLASRTSSGFIYYIDQVVPPQLSIEQYLKNRPEYSTFYNLIQRFQSYSAWTDPLTRIQYYSKAYSGFEGFAANIANDQGPSAQGSGSPEPHQRTMFTAFMPNNDVLKKYFDDNLAKSFASYDEVPNVTIKYLLEGQMINTLSLISMMQKNFFNRNGDPLVINKSDINSSFMCSNGIVYGINRVLEPTVFSCVPGRFLLDKNYSVFAIALSSAGRLAILSNPRSDVTLFAPTNQQIEAYNIRYRPLTNVFERVANNGAVYTMLAVDLAEFVDNHIYSGKLSDLTGEGYVKMLSQNYVYYNNGKIWGGENQFKNNPIEINGRVDNPRNGISYDISDPIKTNVTMGQFLYDSASNPDCYLFSRLMVKAEMLNPIAVIPSSQDVVPSIALLSALTFCTAFIPDNDAIIAEKGRANSLIPKDIDKRTIPLSTSGKDSLVKFISYHFIRNTAVFDDGKQSGSLITLRAGTEGITAINAPKNLSIKDFSGNIIPVNHNKANALVRKGVVHKITSVLKFK